MTYPCVYKPYHVYSSGADYVECPTGWYVYPDELNHGYNGNWFKAHEMVFIKKWCQDHLSYDWDITYQWLYISNKEDAILFKLTWN